MSNMKARLHVTAEVLMCVCVEELSLFNVMNVVPLAHAQSLVHGAMSNLLGEKNGRPCSRKHGKLKTVLMVKPRQYGATVP